MYVGLWTYVAIALLLGVMGSNYIAAILVGLVAVLPYIYYRGYRLNKKINGLRVPKNNVRGFYARIGLTRPPLLDTRAMISSIILLLLLASLMLYFNLRNKTTDSAVLLIALLGWVRVSISSKKR